MAQIVYETPEFRANSRRGSRHLQRAIEAFIRKFDHDAQRDSIRPAEGASDPRVKVARVDQSRRAVLVHLDEGDYALSRVLEHDAAYESACAFSPDISSFNRLPRLTDGSPTAANLIGELACVQRVSTGAPLARTAGATIVRYSARPRKGLREDRRHGCAVATSERLLQPSRRAARSSLRSLIAVLRTGTQ
jgi:hypothetical protein